MSSLDSNATLTSKQFEVQIEKLLKEWGGDLLQLEVRRLEKIQGVDGEYEIDVTVRFEVLNGAKFLILAECKHYKTSSIEREKVQILKDKIQSIGAHKGMIFSTAAFQNGAIKYAEKHGIALIRITDGSAAWYAKSEAAQSTPDFIPTYVGWLITPNDEVELKEDDASDQVQSLLCSANKNLFDEWIKGD